MLLLAALSADGLVRSLGGSPAGAFASGLTFGFSGFIFTWLGYPLAATAALAATGCTVKRRGQPDCATAREESGGPGSN